MVTTNEEKSGENIRITEHGVKLLDELQKIREAFQASDDLSLDQQDQLADAISGKSNAL